MDTAWMMKTLVEDTTSTSTHMLQRWAKSYKITMNASPEDLEPNLGLHTIDPETRYKNLNMTK